MNSSLSMLKLNAEHVDITSTFVDNKLAIGATAVLGGVFLWYMMPPSEKTGIKKIRAWPIVGHWSFFSRRYEYVLRGFKKWPHESMFTFDLLRRKVVVVRGEAARRIFFESKYLSFEEGYNFLFDVAPKVNDVAPVDQKMDSDGMESFIARRLVPLLRMDRLDRLTPLFMADIERNMVKWNEEGQLDPFKDMYSIIFQLTTRATGCREIADSIEECKKFELLFQDLAQGITPTSVLLPWVPSMARIKRMVSTTKAYFWIDRIIKARQSENRREDDALQSLIDSGDTTVEIIQFILGILLAGIINTGMAGAWIFIYLDQAPEWRDKVVEELRTLLNEYAPASENHASLAERFSQVPSKAWENEMPILEVCLRETLRLIMSGAAPRRVIRENITIEGKTIPKDSYLLYLLDDAHTNPNIYPDPNRFDPGRYSTDEAQSQAHPYLAWGIGRHPCLGRRFAQYELKAMCSMFLASYEYDVVNSKGEKPDPLTTGPDKNNLHLALPKNESYCLRYTKRQTPL